jgi:hypothetical protein
MIGGKMMNKRWVVFTFLFTFLFICCAVNIFAARYYRMLEHERIWYLGLRGIDTAAAVTYLNLESTQERNDFYNN